jgi:ribosomal protein L22
MADEKDPKDTTPAKKPRARRKPKAEPAAAGAKVSETTAVAADEPTAAAKAEPKAKAAAKAAAKTGDAAEAKPKRRTPRRAKADATKPAAAATKSRRPARDYGDNPPMVRAHAKYVRTSARKARLVCDHIRGKSVEEARAILAHASRDVARDWSKLLESAVANAEHNHELIGDELRIAAVKADEGPTLKRFRPRAMGRATKIRKRTSHLSITLTPKDGE